MLWANDVDGESRLFDDATAELARRASTSHAALKDATEDGARREAGASSSAEASWNLDGLPCAVPAADPALPSAHDAQHGLVKDDDAKEEDAASQYDLSAQAIAVPMDWSKVLYLDNGKLDVLTAPVDPPSADFEFKGYIAKDRCDGDVAAWFVRRGATGPGTRRPNKGASGVNRGYHQGLWKAKNSDSSGYAAEAFKRKHWHEYVANKSRK